MPPYKVTVLCINGDENAAVVSVTSRRESDGLVNTEAWCEFCWAEYEEENEDSGWTILKVSHL
jgi:hypothetical protein